MISQTVLVSNPGICAESFLTDLSFFPSPGGGYKSVGGIGERVKIQSCWEWNHLLSGFDAISSYSDIL